MRELTEAGMSLRTIADTVGVSKSQVSTDRQVSSAGHLSVPAPAVDPETGEVGADYPEPPTLP